MLNFDEVSIQKYYHGNIVLLASEASLPSRMNGTILLYMYVLVGRPLTSAHA